MKTAIKTTILLTCIVVFTVNAKRINKACVASYENCVSFMANNADMPHGF